MKTRKPKCILTKAQAAEIRKSKKELEYCFLLVQRAASEALRSELLGILLRKTHELKDSIDATLVTYIMTKTGNWPYMKKFMHLADPPPTQSDHADLASAQIILGELKSG